MFGSTAKIIVQLVWSLCLFGVGIWLTQLWPGSTLELWGWFLKYGALIPITILTVVLAFRGLGAWLMFQTAMKRRGEADGSSDARGPIGRVLTSFAVWNSLLVVALGFCVILLAFQIHHIVDWRVIGSFVGKDGYSDLLYPIRNTMVFGGRAVFWIGVALTIFFVVKAALGKKSIRRPRQAPNPEFSDLQ